MDQVVNRVKNHWIRHRKKPRSDPWFGICGARKKTKSLCALSAKLAKEISNQELQLMEVPATFLPTTRPKSVAGVKKFTRSFLMITSSTKASSHFFFINSVLISTHSSLYSWLIPGEQDYDVEKTALKLLNELRDANKKVQLQGNVKRLMSKAPEVRDMQVIDRAICRSCFLVFIFLILYLLSHMHMFLSDGSWNVGDQVRCFGEQFRQPPIPQLRTSCARATTECRPSERPSKPQDKDCGHSGCPL